MIDNLLARLRGSPGPRGFEKPFHVTMSEAADEIERLRAEIDRMKSTFIDLNLEITRKDAALQKIIKNSCRETCTEAQRITKIAYAAIERESDND